MAAKARGDAQNAAAWGDVVAVCDVDESARRGGAVEEKLTVEGKAPELYADFRRVLERKDVDVIVNGTPDHWHTLVNLGAAGRARSLRGEAADAHDRRRPAAVPAVRKQGIVLQTGTQQRSSPDSAWRASSSATAASANCRTRSVVAGGIREGPFATAPVPADLNWDFWLGQAPKSSTCRSDATGNSGSGTTTPAAR